MYRAQPCIFEIVPGQTLSVVPAGDATRLTLQTSAPGQQQSQQAQFATGAWLAEPTAWRSGAILFVHLQAQHGIFWLQAGQGQLSVGSPPPQGAVPVPAHPAPTAGPPPPLAAMAPMAPMAPMQMQMGDMTMSMGRPHEPGLAELQAENLRLREENLRLREENLRLREEKLRQGS